MAATTVPSEPEAGSRTRLVRFDRVERVVHWSTAGLFFIALATAAALYIDALSVLVGRRNIVREIHVGSGLLLPAPFLAAWGGRRWGRALRLDGRRLNRWDAQDWRWLRSFGRDPYVRLDKFNPGQKLNAAFLAGAVVLMAATGSIMRWFDPFPLSWRMGATFVHDWLAVGLFVAIVGHVWLALRDPDALDGMRRGSVPVEWAKRKRPRWADSASESGSGDGG